MVQASAPALARRCSRRLALALVVAAGVLPPLGPAAGATELSPEQEQAADAALAALERQSAAAAMAQPQPVAAAEAAPALPGSEAAEAQLVTLAIPLPPPVPRLYAITPERRALLNTIRYAEGTWANGQDVGYRIMFGGGLMASLDAHPNRVVRSRRYASAAAGAYQFMPPTWLMVTRALGFSISGPNAFGPQVQDQAALYLVQRRGALPLADQGLFTPELAHRLAPEWASFPTMAGHSYYGQPVKRFQELRSFYETNLAQLRASQGQASYALQLRVQPPKPACTPADSLRCRIEALDTLGSGASGRL